MFIGCNSYSEWSGTRTYFIDIVFNFVLQYAITKLQENYEKMEMNRTEQFLVYADDVNLFGEYINTIKTKIEAPLDASKEVGSGSKCRYST
jgi:hypothetical protein